MAWPWSSTFFENTRERVKMNRKLQNMRTRIEVKQ